MIFAKLLILLVSYFRAFLEARIVDDQLLECSQPIGDEQQAEGCRPVPR